VTAFELPRSGLQLALLTENRENDPFGRRRQWQNSGKTNAGV
jgi:hypothetical protein